MSFLVPPKNLSIAITASQPQCTLPSRCLHTCILLTHEKSYSDCIYGDFFHTWMWVRIPIIECEDKDILLSFYAVPWSNWAGNYIHANCISENLMWGSMYSAKWLGETAFFFLTMSRPSSKHTNTLYAWHITQYDMSDKHKEGNEC